jgi:hypothetical protein
MEWNGVRRMLPIGIHSSSFNLRRFATVSEAAATAGRRITLVSHVALDTCHTLHVSCHVSLVTHFVSYVTHPLGTSVASLLHLRLLEMPQFTGRKHETLCV